MLKFSLSNKKAQRAFSLIELMLSFLIVAFLIGFATQYFRKKDRKIRATFEELSRVNQRLISLSFMKSSGYRLVFDLSLEKPDRYWVEKKTAQKISPLDGLSEALAKNWPENSTREGIELAESNSSTDDFEIDTSFYPDPAEISSFLDITKIETNKTVYQEGKVFIDYNDAPLAQEWKIEFFRPDNQARWILLFDPVSKQMKLID